MSLQLLVATFMMFNKITLQHFVENTDSCNLANSCNHTFNAECGEEISLQNKRMFLDDCDMFEYNCDNKKAYVKVNISECQDTTTITTPITTSSVFNSSSSVTEKTTNSTDELDTSTDIYDLTDTISAETIALTNETEITSLTTPLDSISPVNPEVTTTHVSPSVNSTTIITVTTITTTTISPKNITSSTSTSTKTRVIPFMNTTNYVTETTTGTSEASISSSKSEVCTRTSPVSNESKTTITILTQSSDTAIPYETTLTGKMLTQTTDTATTDIKDATSVIKTVNPESSHTTSNPCHDFPEDCDRPVTWETTAAGETRDFYRILKDRYGRRALNLNPTSRWPIGTRYMSNLDNSFFYGRHSERRWN